MLKDIDIQEACNIIYAFAEANHVDALTGIELMVTHFTQLSKNEQEAITDFMVYTRQG
jgi:hypothetical protein